MIYFIQTASGSIKIGTTINLRARLTALANEYQAPVSLLGTRPGGAEEEKEIHGRFAHLRLGKTEQFRPAPELLEFIGKPLLASAAHDAVKAARSRRDSRRRKFIMLELKDDERARLDRLVAAGGERASYASVLRELIDRAAEKNFG